MSESLEDLSTKELEAIMDGEEAVPEAAPEPEQTAPAEDSALPEDDGGADLDKLLDTVEEEPPAAEPTVEELREELAKTRRSRDELASKYGILKQARRLEAEPVYPEEPRYADPNDAAAATAAARGDFMDDAQAAAIVRDELAEFAARHPDIGKYEDSVKLLAQTIAGPVRKAAATGNRAYFQSVVGEQLDDLMREARMRDRRRVEQFGAMRQAKLAAGSVLSAPASAPPPRQKSLQEMSVKELGGLLDEMVPPPKPARRR